MNECRELRRQLRGSRSSGVRSRKRVAAELRHGGLEVREVGERTPRARVADCLERLRGVGDHGPAADLLHGVVLGALVEPRRQCREPGLVFRLGQRDCLGLPVLHTEHREAQLVAERRPDVAVEIELVLAQPFLKRRQRTGQVVDRFPLGRVEVGVDADERQGRRRNERRVVFSPFSTQIHWY